MKNAVIAWAEKRGYSFRVFVNNSIDKKPVGILIYTDYIGPYPTSEVYETHEKIRRYCIRTGRKYASCAMRTGARIYF